MAMAWSYSDEPAVYDAAMRALGTWTHDDLAQVCAETEPTPAGTNVFFPRERYIYYHSLPRDILEQNLWDMAEVIRLCSNDFSKLYLDDNGWYTIDLNDDPAEQEE